MQKLLYCEMEGCFVQSDVFYFFSHYQMVVGGYQAWIFRAHRGSELKFELFSLLPYLYTLAPELCYMSVEGGVLN